MTEDAIILETVLHQAPGIVMRRIAGEILLIPVKGRVADLQRVFVLNPVGERIWTGLAQPRPLGELAAEIADLYDVAKEKAQSDALEFVAELLEAGLATR
jgi:hypothetical protein